MDILFHLITSISTMCSVDSYVLHYRARGQSTWETRTVLVPPVDNPSTEKVCRTPFLP